MGREPIAKRIRLARVCAFPVLVAAMGSHVLAEEEPPPFLEEVTIVGSRDDVRNMPGAAHVVGPEDLARFAYTDIQRMARQVPGVSIQVEDGYGLRPNISIRGVASERSGRITLLEDNVLIAPAPYSAPSAYYFPTAGRMHSLEVLKGHAAITQGPYTIGGALNLVSTPIPSETTGSVVAEGGQHGTWRLHATYGGSTDLGLGFLIETHQWVSDGYQAVDRGGDSGLVLSDYTLKARFAPPDSRHGFDVKLQFADQVSDQSYLGLTDVDFASDPFRRYGLSALDEIETDHEQLILRYTYALGTSAEFSAVAYNNTHARNWFKTEGIDFDGSENAQTLSRTSWSNVIRAANTGATLSGLDSTGLLAILHGTADTPAGSIQIRSNAREYFSRGLQLGLAWNPAFADTDHSIEMGVRLHADEEDRLQRNSAYSQRRGALVLDDAGLLGNAGNRIQEARAVAVFVQDRIEIDRWSVSAGFRYEDIEQQRTRYETRSGRTADPAARSADNLRDRRENSTRVLLPGVGASFDAAESAQFFIGAHKGFTAPSNAPGVEEETAFNYEAGARIYGQRWSGEFTAFLSDYDNLLGECTASSGADCEIGDAFNGDAATVRGLEASFSADLSTATGLQLPLTLTFTHMDARFDSDVADTDFFGDVRRGDPLPYLPKQQAHAVLGVLRGRAEANIALQYVDEVCVRASCGNLEKTDSALTVDAAASWRLNPRVTLFARIENLTRSTGILGRHPYGARPNKDRAVAAGVRAAF